MVNSWADLWFVRAAWSDDKAYFRLFLPYSESVLIEVWKIQIWLGTNEFYEHEVISEMVASMRLKFDKYYEKYSDILAIAAVFDLRLKFKVLE